MVRSTISVPEIQYSCRKIFLLNFFFNRRQNILIVSGHRNSSGFLPMIIFNIYHGCFCQLSDNAMIAFKGEHSVDQLGYAWSCRCLEKTEDHGEDWSYWTHMLLRDINGPSLLHSEQGRLFHWRFTPHILQAPLLSRRGWYHLRFRAAPDRDSHVWMLLDVTRRTARVILVGLRGIVHLPHNFCKEFVHHCFTLGRRLHEGAAPLFCKGSAFIGGHFSLTFQIYFVPDQDDWHFLIPTRE